MKKTIIAAAALLLFAASCKKDLTSLNVDPKNPLVVPSYSLFSNAQKNLADHITTPNVNINIFRLIAQQWAQTTYIDESTYDLDTRSIPQTWWDVFYRDVIRDLNEAKKLIPADVLDAGRQQNEIAIADMLQVFAYYHLVSTYGDIPYTDAEDINNIKPGYDDAATVYNSLLTRLSDDIGKLDDTKPAYEAADLLYGGDITLWRKFAYSLQLKMAMLIADSDEALAKSLVEAASANTFASNDDNAVFYYTSTPPNTNPVWVNLVQSGRKDFVAANTLVDQMNALSDPRLPFYFTTDDAGVYTGGIYGSNNAYSIYSKPADALTVADYPAIWLDYSEIEFLKAEAAERGFNTGATAETHYNNAIQASVTAWGGTGAQADEYLANTAVNYATAAGDWKEKIGTQAWIALYNRGYDAWTEWRRLDYPVLLAPADALSDVPLRYTYPVNEQNLNTGNYNTAAAAIGGDNVSTKLWFDTH